MTRPNVLYVTVDSIRADRIGHLGYDRPTTPTIDGLAADGTTCSRAIASGIPTYYSFKTLLGGVPALGGSHGIGMPETATPVAEAFRRRGYQTAGFNAGNPWLTREYGYDRGFETFRDFLTDDDPDDGGGVGRSVTKLLRGVQPYVESSEFLTEKLGFAARSALALADHSPMESAETVTDAAVEWLRARDDDRPFFLWVHYMDPHYPWVPRSEDAERFCDGGVSRIEVGRLWHAVSAYEDGDGGTVSDADADRIADLYDAEVRRTDDAIDRLLDALAERGERGDTVVSVVGDHGTELHDHGDFSHGPRTLYDEVVRVPLVFEGPGVPDRRLDGVTSLLDVPATLFDAAGIDHERTDVVGSPVFEGDRDRAVTEVVYDFEPRSGENADNGLLRACVAPPWKLVANEELGTRELYHLERDPDERTDVAEDHPAVVDRLAAALDEERRRVERHTNTAREKAHVRSTIEDLDGRGLI